MVMVYVFNKIYVIIQIGVFLFLCFFKKYIRPRHSRMGLYFRCSNILRIDSSNDDGLLCLYFFAPCLLPYGLLHTLVATRTAD